VNQCKIIFKYIQWTRNFSEFIRFFQKGWNPFKIHERFKLDLVRKIYIRRYSGNWKFSQWTKLFTTFKSSPLKSLNIVGTREGRESELQSVEAIWLIRKTVWNYDWARPSAKVPTCSNRQRPARVQTEPRSWPHPPLSCSPRWPLPPALPGSTRCTCSCHPVCNAPSWRPDAGIVHTTHARPLPPQGVVVGRPLSTSRHLRSTRRTCSHRPCTLPPRYRSEGEAVHSFSHSCRRAPATPLDLAITTFPRPPSTATSGAPPAPSTPPVASPELGGALQPHQPSQRQPADPLTGAPLRSIAIAAVSPPRWASCRPSPQIGITVDRVYRWPVSRLAEQAEPCCGLSPSVQYTFSINFRILLD
jgi:hypothetical protein